MKTKVMGAFLSWGRSLPVLILLLPSFSAGAQRVTLRKHHVAIVDALAEIGRQTGCSLLYSPAIFEDAPKIDLDIVNLPARKALRECLQGLRYSAESADGNTFIISREAGSSPFADLVGTVTNTGKEPLAQATVSAAGGATVLTDTNGQFRLPVTDFVTRITVSHAGYATQTGLRDNKGARDFRLTASTVGLDAIVVVAYGKITQRMNTSVVTTVKGEEITGQPVSNFVGALEGRVTRLAIRQYNGVPGSAYETYLGGKHSIQQGNEPLYVLDGVPLPGGGFLPPMGSGSAQGTFGASSLNGIPTGIISSIEVLKDASATAIYGSRASNGVILISTVEGKGAGSGWTAEFSQGASRVVSTSPMLTTTQFLQLRREAIHNDKDSVNPQTLPEASLWDTSRSVDYKKYISKGTGSYRDIRLGFTGGDSLTRLLLSGSAHNESGVFPGTTTDQRLSLYTNLQHQAMQRRLKISFNALYSREDTHLPWTDYSPYGYLAADAPAFTDARGQLLWGTPTLYYENIVAQRHNTYGGSTDYLFGQVQLHYWLSRTFSLEGNFGGNSILTKEQSLLTIKGQYPDKTPPATASSFSDRINYKSGIIEIWGKYEDDAGPGRLQALAGVSYQGEGSDYSSLLLSGISSDLQLASGTGATMTTPASDKAYYRYEAAFGRVNYNIANRYLFDLSGRRDGSSRFGSGDQFGNFWGVGGGWIFSEEPFARGWKGISYGKVKASYGTTGNDQIGDYQFAPLYTGTSSTQGYQGQQGFTPANLANNQLRWELNYREEASVELGFWHDRLHLTAGAYRSHTRNQLVFTQLAPQAGFPGVLSNQPANVVNEGLEFQLQANVPLGELRWWSTLVLTVPRNYLKSWSELARSSLSATVVQGKSLSVTKGLHFTGVDSATGLYTFYGVDHNGQVEPGDYLPSPSLDPKWYGGWSTDWQYKGFSLGLFFEYRKENGVNPLTILDQRNPAGMEGPFEMSNGPREWLTRWQKPGDKTSRQMLTASKGSAAYGTLQEYLQSDAAVTDASFLRLKTVSLQYQFQPAWREHHRLRDLKVYIRGQNLWTRTRYPVTDPETQNPIALPPMRTLVAGFQIAL